MVFIDRSDRFLVVVGTAPVHFSMQGSVGDRKGSCSTSNRYENTDYEEVEFAIQGDVATEAFTAI